MKTILVVDDNFDNRAIISQILQMSGYSVLTATTGRDALKRLEAHRPDLILMDMGMPELDGWTTTSRIKANPYRAHIPILAVTGYATTNEINRALASGCVDYLTKPLDFDLLIGKVRRLLQEDASFIS